MHYNAYYFTGGYCEGDEMLHIKVLDWLQEGDFDTRLLSSPPSSIKPKNNAPPASKRRKQQVQPMNTLEKTLSRAYDEA